jgi:hypothetical protein
MESLSDTIKYIEFTLMTDAWQTTKSGRGRKAKKAPDRCQSPAVEESNAFSVLCEPLRIQPSPRHSPPPEDGDDHVRRETTDCLTDPEAKPAKPIETSSEEETDPEYEQASYANWVWNLIDSVRTESGKSNGWEQVAGIEYYIDTDFAFGMMRDPLDTTIVLVACMIRPDGERLTQHLVSGADALKADIVSLIAAKAK